MTPANQYADMNNFMIVLHQVHAVYMRQSTTYKNITLRVINKA